MGVAREVLGRSGSFYIFLLAICIIIRDGIVEKAKAAAMLSYTLRLSLGGCVTYSRKYAIRLALPISPPIRCTTVFAWYSLVLSIATCLGINMTLNEEVSSCSLGVRDLLDVVD